MDALLEMLDFRQIFLGLWILYVDAFFVDEVGNLFVLISQFFTCVLMVHCLRIGLCNVWLLVFTTEFDKVVYEDSDSRHFNF